MTMAYDPWKFTYDGALEDVVDEDKASDRWILSESASRKSCSVWYSVEVE